MMRSAILAGATAIAVLASAAALAQQTGSRQTREYVQSAGQSDAFEKLEAETALTQSMIRRFRPLRTRCFRITAG